MTLSFIHFESTAIRVFARDGSPWFVLPDLCRALGIDDARETAARLEDYERTAADVPAATGGREVVIAVNLSGFYTVLSHARGRSVAKSLKRCVATQVLPSMLLRDEPILLPPGAEEGLHSTTEIAEDLGMVPGVLGKQVTHLKTARHGEWRPASGLNSDKPIERWWWNDAGRDAVLREFGILRARTAAAR